MEQKKVDCVIGGSNLSKRELMISCERVDLFLMLSRRIIPMSHLPIFLQLKRT